MTRNYGRFALFDWDNTLRKGFTVVSWVKYLCNQRIVDETNYVELLHQFKLYESREIAYQQLSDNTTQIYAQSIAGVDVSNLEKLAYRFCQQDHSFFEFTSPLLRILRESGIEIIVISGSPKLVLLQYAKQLGINEVYGMDIEVKSGQYTGVLTKDYGAEKREIVRDICKSKGLAPILAFGDSAADDPLLKVSKYGFLIDEKSGQISVNGTIVGAESTICEIVTSLCL